MKRHPIASLAERIRGVFYDHRGLQFALMFAATLAILLAVGWFVLFSGLSSSGGFVYNQF